METQRLILKPIDRGQKDARGVRCFCERPATYILTNRRYYYCSQHAAETSRLYAQWILAGGGRREGSSANPRVRSAGFRTDA